MHDINDLVLRAQQNDLTACSELYYMTLRGPYYFALRFVKDKDTAAHIVSQIYKNAFESIHNLRRPENIEMWLRYITAKTCVEYMQAENRLTFGGSYESDYSQRIDSDTEFLPAGIENAEKACVALDRVMDSLSDNHRAVVLLHYINGMPVFNIAEVLGCTQADVTVELESARFAIKTEMDKLMGCETVLYPMGENPLIAVIFSNAKDSIGISKDLAEEILCNAVADLVQPAVEEAVPAVVADIQQEYAAAEQMPEPAPEKKAKSGSSKAPMICLAAALLFVAVVAGVILATSLLG